MQEKEEIFNTQKVKLQKKNELYLLICKKSCNFAGNLRKYKGFE